MKLNFKLRKIPADVQYTLVQAGLPDGQEELFCSLLAVHYAMRKSGVSPLQLLETWQTLRNMEQGGAGMLSEERRNL